MTSPVHRHAESTHRGRARLWTLLVIAILVFLALALLEIAFLVEVGSAHARRGSSLGASVVLAVIDLGLVVLAGRWLMHVEHRLRSGQPAAEAGGATRPSRWRRPFAPFAAALYLVLVPAGAIGLTIGTISEIAQGNRSAYVQSHGIPVAGRVISLSNSSECGRGECTYSAADRVALERAIDGTRTTTVHLPETSPFVRGQTVTVLVDPHDPSYAELPGDPFKSTSAWVSVACFAAVFYALTFGIVRAVVRRRRVRRSP